MEDLEGCLVTLDAELALKLKRAHAGRLRGDEIGAPEPDLKRGLRAVHDGAGPEADLLLAVTAHEDMRACLHVPGFADDTTGRAPETFGPPDLL